VKLNFQVRISHTHAELFRNIVERRGTSNTALLESMIDREVERQIQMENMRGAHAMEQHWSDVFGGDVTAAGIVFETGTDETALVAWLKATYEEMARANGPASGYEINRYSDADFARFARQIIEEAEQETVYSRIVGDSLPRLVDAVRVDAEGIVIDQWQYYRQTNGRVSHDEKPHIGKHIDEVRDLGYRKEDDWK